MFNINDALLLLMPFGVVGAAVVIAVAGARNMLPYMFPGAPAPVLAARSTLAAAAACACVVDEIDLASRAAALDDADACCMDSDATIDA